MPTVKAIQQQLEEANSIKLVTQALGEIAAIKLKNTRNDVQQNTQFFTDIANVYHQVKVVAARHQILTKKDSQSSKNGKTISVLLTSNLGFFGGLDVELTKVFINTSAKYQTERLVVGKFANTYLHASSYPQPFESVVFKKDSPDPVELKALIDKTINYSKILLYHSKFVTVLKQEPEISDVSGTGNEIDEAFKSDFDYIVEPEIAKMVTFFESQILTLLYKAIFLETELSKTAARMISMYEAESNADKIVLQYKRQMAHANRTLQNIKILETYIGIRNLLKTIRD